MFDWQDRYSVHVHSIDFQHKKLFHLAGELHRGMVAGDSKPVLGQMLDHLLYYTEMHFAYEERLLEHAHTPNVAARKKEHEALMRKLGDFQRDFEKGKAIFTIGLLQFLRMWLQQHMLESVRKPARPVSRNAAA
jgi:hemerythrin-like metal-binding protein